MNSWLYDADGYYASYKPIGKNGDFYTSVSTSKFFGGSIAKHIISLIQNGFLSKDATICEIGAHHGYLLADIIEFIYTLQPELIKSLKFVIVERFDTLIKQQQEYFKASFGDIVKITHYHSLDEFTCKEAFFIANEIFDAFGCELLYDGKIASVVNSKVVFDTVNEDILKKAKKYHKQKGEIAVGYEEFAKQMSNCADKFEFMSFDYGEMQARPDFSLRVYKNHKVYPFFDESINIFDMYKNSDITYDVTFEHVKDAFVNAGVEFIELKAQMTTLIDMGLLELLQILKDKAGDKIYAQEVDKIKPLISPEFLGERFKMIRFQKNNINNE